MGNPTGFLDFERELPRYRTREERVSDFHEFVLPFPEEKTRKQAARCMDCGVPFCHNGCPLGNLIPEFNDAVYQAEWKTAYRLLAKTNPFPEFTGRICPAPCEKSCVLGLNQDPVTIEHIEKAIVEEAFKQGWIQAKPPASRTGKRIAVIGSGPAGMAAAHYLNQSGHSVTVYDRDEAPGGLLRYGIPDFKLEKWVIDRRLNLMIEEGIEFVCNVEIGRDISGEQLKTEYDAVVVCAGAPQPREMGLPGRELSGVHFAMEYLTQQNRMLAGTWDSEALPINAKDKHVLVIGGGDTGSDCIGTANRQGAASVTQITWGPEPSEERSDDNPWPEWPMTLQTSSSHEEGCERDWSVLTKSFVGDATNKLTAMEVVDIRWEPKRAGYEEIAETLRELPCDLALIAVGFQGADRGGLWDQLGVSLDKKGRLRGKKFHTEVPGVFTAGDVHRGQSLVVWAQAEGRDAARSCMEWMQSER